MSQGIEDMLDRQPALEKIHGATGWQSEHDSTGSCATWSRKTAAPRQPLDFAA